MFRGKVTAVTDAGVYVLCADVASTPIGPCQAVVAPYAVNDQVLVVNVGTDVQPDLVVVGTVAADGESPFTAGGVLKVRDADGNAWVMRESVGVYDIYDTWSVNGHQRFYIAGTQSDWTLVTEADLVGGRISALNVARTTGRVTFGAAGPTAGIELGSGGPTITSGTGAPSHSAPNGSTYHRTDGTASTTLYVRAAGAWTALS